MELERKAEQSAIHVLNHDPQLQLINGCNGTSLLVSDCLSLRPKSSAALLVSATRYSSGVPQLSWRFFDKLMFALFNLTMMVMSSFLLSFREEISDTRHVSHQSGVTLSHAS
ncbi:PREDICTED: uncharacterized protein LOC106321771 isoform X2 [Brassica oleracea var. oleracea]|uniref:uncharacterized protein LOC106296058 isoform X2 n=1 Tax=Brassica oleracea var. oleracea TaxID=109376 RepID=UPI0006A6FF6F|nr:PREDICTED: uncharacterized protein LOC106296058 isoform X2 [Brassica oleracea var. oleracea]XP_013615464.1 PREDICTED: uncharacterized protein LOC106321771 isoform X2 [Brassica oleracea var. oleracea]